MESQYNCRICLESGEDSNFQMIYKDLQENVDIIQKIELCGGIKVIISGNLPDKICGKCFCALNISYDFRQLCQSSDLKLRDISIELDEHKTDVKDESDRDSLMQDIFLEPLTDQIAANNEAGEVERKVNEQTPIKQKSRKTVPVPTRKTKSKSQETHICEQCGNFYKRRCHLMMHMKRHSAVKPYNCEICKKAFASQSEINRHIRIHTGDKPYKCKYCDRKFSDCSSNTRHERTHTNERPFECNTCGKTFTYSSVLKFHMMVHTGEKRFRCSVCNKTFTRAHQLKQHLMTIVHQQRAAKGNLLKIDADNNNISADSNSSTVE